MLVYLSRDEQGSPFQTYYCSKVDSVRCLRITLMENVEANRQLGSVRITIWNQPKSPIVFSLQKSPLALSPDKECTSSDLSALI